MVQSVIESTTGKTTTIGLYVSGALGVNIAMRVDVVPIAWLVDGVIESQGCICGVDKGLIARLLAGFDVEISTKYPVCTTGVLVHVSDQRLGCFVSKVFITGLAARFQVCVENPQVDGVFAVAMQRVPVIKVHPVDASGQVQAIIAFFDDAM